MKAKQLASCLCTALLTISLFPPRALAEMTGGEAYFQEAEDLTRKSIEELLAAGDYVEGEAIAVVRENDSEGLLGEGEEIATASAESVKLAAGEAVASEAVADDMMALRSQSIEADEYHIKLVVDHSRTTEEILTDLYNDPNVVSAEPYYVVEGPWDPEDPKDPEGSEEQAAVQAEDVALTA